MNCWNLVIPLRAIGIGYNWFVWALREKRSEYEQRHDKVILLHDAWPYVVKVLKKYLETLKWILPHPSYSPDIAPSDYWLFRRMQHDLTSHRFTSFAKIENWLQNWIASKDEFFSRWNSKIAWEKKVAGSDGQYFNWSVHSFYFEINAQKNGPN